VFVLLGGPIQSRPPKAVYNSLSLIERRGGRISTRFALSVRRDGEHSNIEEKAQHYTNATCQHISDGMAGHGEEDYFDDADFDALPDSEFIELENKAIQFTQAQTQARAVVAPSSDYGDEFDEIDFNDDEVVIDESRSTAAVVATIHRSIPGQATQQERFRQQRYGTINSSNSIAQIPNRPRPTPPRFNETVQVRPRAATPLNDSIVAQQGSQPSDVKVESLQEQLEEVCGTI
jgi:hypothetical protein